MTLCNGKGCFVSYLARLNKEKNKMLPVINGNALIVSLVIMFMLSLKTGNTIYPALRVLIFPSHLFLAEWCLKKISTLVIWFTDEFLLHNLWKNSFSRVLEFFWLVLLLIIGVTVADRQLSQTISFIFLRWARSKKLCKAWTRWWKVKFKCSGQ